MLEHKTSEVYKSFAGNICLNENSLLLLKGAFNHVNILKDKDKDEYIISFEHGLMDVNILNKLLGPTLMIGKIINPKEWGLNGNLIVNINLLKKVSENITKVYIDFIKAIEGCSLNLNLDEGKFNINLNIPSGIKSGTKLKVSKGDNLYLIEVLITVPKLEKLNKKSTKLITQLKELL